jgi:hypothetical protein
MAPASRSSTSSKAGDFLARTLRELSEIFRDGAFADVPQGVLRVARAGFPSRAAPTVLAVASIRIGEIRSSRARTGQPTHDFSGTHARRPTNVTSNEVWFITGAGRGMGMEFAEAALAAGHSVVATGRNIETVRKAVGVHDELLVARETGRRQLPQDVDQIRTRPRPIDHELDQRTYADTARREHRDHRLPSEAAHEQRRDCDGSQDAQSARRPVVRAMLVVRRHRAGAATG